MKTSRQTYLFFATALLFSFGWDMGLGQVRWRPTSERDAFDRRSPYRQWLAQEGIPVYEGHAIADLKKLELKPSKRLGVPAAYVFLEGTGAIVDALVWEVPVGQATHPERHIFEEQVLVLSGEGETLVWQSNGKKQAVVWRKGSVFAPPLNAWHQHVNKGKEAAKLVAITGAPLLFDIFRDPDFIYDHNHDFGKRYSGQTNYFDPEISKDYPPADDHALSIVNLVRNAFTVELFSSGQGVGDQCRHYVLSDNSMGAHIEEFPVGTYERAHRHGAGASVILLDGTGYTIMWPKELGTRPYAEGKGDKVLKLDWQEGSLIVPPDQWYHQHFNTGKTMARFIKLGTPIGNRVYRVTSKIFDNQSGHLIKYADEDPGIREMFADKLKKNGASLQMPAVAELVEMEREAEKLFDPDKVPTSQWPPLRIPTQKLN